MASEDPSGITNGSLPPSVPKAYTPAQKFALEGLYNQSRELKSHGGARGALLKLQSAYPQQFVDQTEARIQQWFKTRRKHQNRRQRYQEGTTDYEHPSGTFNSSLRPDPSDAAHQTTSQGIAGDSQARGNANLADLCRMRTADGQTEASAAASADQEEQDPADVVPKAELAANPDAALHVHEETLNPIPQGDYAAPEEPLGDRSERQKKYTADYKLRQSLYKQIDKYCAKAGGQTEVALCISSSTQRDSIWVHGRGLAMNSAARRDVLANTFRELISRKREDFEQGLTSEGEEEGGGGVRQGNYKRRVPAYADFVHASESHIQEELQLRGLTPDQRLVTKLCARIWHLLSMADKRLLQSGTSIRALLAHRTTLWNEAYAAAQQELQAELLRQRPEHFMAPFGVPAAMTESEQEAALISAHASNLAAGIAGAGATEEAVKLLRVWLTEMAHGQVPVDAKLPQNRQGSLPPQPVMAVPISVLPAAIQAVNPCSTARDEDTLEQVSSGPIAVNGGPSGPSARPRDLQGGADAADASSAPKKQKLSNDIIE